jgi:hypothetical protein
MYMGEGEPAVEPAPLLGLTSTVTAILTVGLSLVPQWMFMLAAGALIR